MGSNYYKVVMKLRSAERRWKEHCSCIPEGSGIYILTRTDEFGIKYAYIGQAKHILRRLCEHLALGYSHIDLSLRKYKFYEQFNNPFGWNLTWFECSEEDLDFEERNHIKLYAGMGYQLYNKTVGGQGVGKSGLGEQKAAKGYYDGLKQGRINAIREIKELFDKYLVAVPDKHKGCCKKDGTLKELYRKKWKEFESMLEEIENGK